MKKIRINVLARELEVKSHLILELLPELGVSEKVTHSSSIDEDVADKLRVRFGLEPVGSGEGPRPESEDGGHSQGAALEEPPPVQAEAELRGPEKPAPAEVAPPQSKPEAEQPVAAMGSERGAGAASFHGRGQEGGRGLVNLTQPGCHSLRAVQPDAPEGATRCGRLGPVPPRGLLVLPSGF